MPIGQCIDRGSKRLILMVLMIALGAAMGCSRTPPTPEGWKVATYSSPEDLRHSDSFQEDPSVIWAVSLVDGALRVKDWSLHLRGNSDEPEHSWSKSGISAEAKATALKFGTYLVEQSPEHTLSYLVRVEDGWLVGFDAGEWSGGLCWVSSDGTQGRFLITQPKFYVPPPPPPPGMSKAKWDRETRTPRSVEPDLPGWIPRKGFRFKDYCSENVIFIAKSQEAYLVFEGLSHMSLDRGQVLKVSRNSDGIWEASKLIGLDGRPYNISRNEYGEWLVVTSKGLLRLDATGKVMEQVSLPDALTGGIVTAVAQESAGKWLMLTSTSLYRLSVDGRSKVLLTGTFISDPEMNSIVRMPDGTVFIGMRHYLMRLLPSGESYKAERLEKLAVAAH